MKNVAASIRQRLLNQARSSGVKFQELVQYFAMCRFLYRLVKSSQDGQFILKGALLLHALKLEEARSTLDIDLLGRISNTPATIREAISQACSEDVEPDGLHFDESSITISEMLQEADYKGLRVKFDGSLGNMPLPMLIDIGFSDVPFPSPKEITVPTLLGFPSATMLGYAPETSIAEKAHAILLPRGHEQSHEGLLRHLVSISVLGA